MTRVLWPDLEPSAAAEGFLPDVPTLQSYDVLRALAARHPMDGFNGAPGRWVFLRETAAATGQYGDVQRFDALAVGLVPSVKYARVVYEVKVSRGDWLRELKPIPDVRWSYNGREHREPAGRARRIVKAIEEDPTGRFGQHYRIAGEYRKWDEALALSTEFWIAAPPHVVLTSELPPEAGLVEVRLWGPDRVPRARVVVKAPVRDTPNPGPEFWASVLRGAAALKPPHLQEAVA